VSDELRGRIILLLDDEVNFVAVMRRIIDRRGGTTVVARSIGEARDALRACLFDVAVIDLLLTNGNGVRFIEELGESHPALPCILCTGVDTASMGAPARPGVYYLEKPVHQDKLVETLLGAMRNAETQPSPPPTEPDEEIPTRPLSERPTPLHEAEDLEDP
jgi:ActR/RegA family two-component response regulator